MRTDGFQHFKTAISTESSGNSGLTYHNWESFEFHDSEQVSLYVPTGCAHGFQAPTGVADVSYFIDRPHDPAEDVSIAYDDPELAIPWPLPVTIRSGRDLLAPLAVATALLAQEN